MTADTVAPNPCFIRVSSVATYLRQPYSLRTPACFTRHPRPPIGFDEINGEHYDPHVRPPGSPQQPRQLGPAL